MYIYYLIHISMHVSRSNHPQFTILDTNLFVFETACWDIC